MLAASVQPPLPATVPFRKSCGRRGSFLRVKKPRQRHRLAFFSRAKDGQTEQKSYEAQRTKHCICYFTLCCRNSCLSTVAKGDPLAAGHCSTAAVEENSCYSVLSYRAHEERAFLLVGRFIPRWWLVDTLRGGRRVVRIGLWMFFPLLPWYVIGSIQRSHTGMEMNPFLHVKYNLKCFLSSFCHSEQLIWKAQETPWIQQNFRSIYCQECYTEKDLFWSGWCKK